MSEPCRTDVEHLARLLCAADVLFGDIPEDGPDALQVGEVWFRQRVGVRENFLKTARWMAASLDLHKTPGA
jgi:hypothetical protein